MLNPDSLSVATTYNNLGALLQNCLGDLHSAFEHYRKALKIQEEHADKKSEASKCQLAHSYFNVGGILYSKDDYEGALSHFMKAIELQESTVPKSH
jgi:tetratricopeptide (TPR) repeat protein